MFNSYQAGDQCVSVNAVSGAILKSHPKSWFERFHLKSSRASQLLKSGCGQIVLQMVICGDMEVVAELVNSSEYESDAEEAK